MYIVVRQYAAAGGLGDLLATRSDEVRDLIGGYEAWVSAGLAVESTPVDEQSTIPDPAPED